MFREDKKPHCGQSTITCLQSARLPCTLKTSFVDFEKELVYCKRYKTLNCSSLPNTLYFVSGNQQSMIRLTHSFSHFYIIIELVLVLSIS